MKIKFLVKLLIVFLFCSALQKRFTHERPSAKQLSSVIFLVVTHSFQSYYWDRGGFYGAKVWSSNDTEYAKRYNEPAAHYEKTKTAYNNAVERKSSK